VDAAPLLGLPSRLARTAGGGRRLCSTGTPLSCAAVADAGELLLLYDRYLRTEAETPGAVSVERLGPLRLVSFQGGRGFVTYPAPGAGETLAEFVEGALEHFRGIPSITRVEWKTRGHDRAPGLHEALLGSGFRPQERESIMLGPARALDVEVPLPEGVALRRVSSPADVAAMTEMEDAAFGSDLAEPIARALLARLERGDGMELWVAEAEGRVVGAGRLEPVAGTPVAGIWGGAVLARWRGRGIYRALTAARARSALAIGCTLIHSDSSEYSRPILQRAGLVAVSTTTPYLWTR